MKYKKTKEKNSKLFIYIYFISIVFFISSVLNCMLIYVMFIGFFLSKNYKRKNYIEKDLKKKDIEEYLQKYNKVNSTNVTIEKFNKEEKHSFPNIIFFSFHAAHESFIEESDIKITDKMIELYKDYSNIKIYAINYYSSLFFPTEKGIKKRSIKIVQNIIDTQLNKSEFYHIAIDGWSLGTCVGLYTINNLQLKKFMQVKSIDLRTPPLNLFNVAYNTVHFLIYSLYPLIFLFQYEDFFNNQTQIQNLITKYPYMEIRFYIPENDNIVDIKEQNKLFNIVNYKYIRNITQFKKGTNHSDDYIIYGLQTKF